MIAIIQPHIPFYRNDFFLLLNAEKELDIFTYSNYNSKSIQLKGAEDLETIGIKSYKLGPFVFFNPFCFLKKKYDTIVLPFNMILVPIWIVLILNRLLLHKKVIIWGHGISIPNYIKESKQPHILKKFLVYMSNAVWVYTDAEKSYWKSFFPAKQIVSLGNSVSIDHSPTITDKDMLKKKFNILQATVIIYCARFNNSYRRVDLLLEAICKANPQKFGFIIIGDGPEKPDFSGYNHVYDFGSVFENQLKSDLFYVSDVYFQPGWVGLSIVEALKRGLPVFTLERSYNIAQCVEYAYLENGYNSIIFKDIPSLIEKLDTLNSDDYKRMGANALLSSSELTVQKMVKQAKSTL